MGRLHADELRVDEDLVRRLLRHAMPSYADRPVRALPATGSSNALFRLGDDLLARLPRQPGGTATIRSEARWLPVVSAGLTTRTPEVVAVGEPGLGYPEAWSVTTWIEGETPAVPPPHRTGHGLAADLARLVGELRVVPVPTAAVEDPALRWYRGGPLVDLDDDLRAAVEECRRLRDLDLDLDAVLRVWDGVLAVTVPDPGPSWFHGDLLAENLLVDGDGLTAVLDFGGLGVGSPAVDLVVAWEVLAPAGRAAFRAAVGVPDAEWATGAGWALLIAVITFPYYWRSMPGRCAARLAMARAVLAELARDPPMA